jgi:hypothetical protein
MYGAKRAKKARKAKKRDDRVPESAGRVTSQMEMVVLLAVIAGTVLVPAGATERLNPLEIFAVAVLAFLPGWMFARFVTVRVQTVQDEYVLNLHRLGMDFPQYLPRPPVGSTYFADWLLGGGPLYEGQRENLYMQKFDVYYGRSQRAGGGYRIKAETFFPVALATAVFVAGWTAVLGKLQLTTVGPQELGALTTPDLLGVAFVGAYLFTLQMLIRRYFQADLKVSAYVNAVVRVASAVILVPVVNDALLQVASPETRVGVAFMVGFFPLVGLQALQKVAAVALHRVVPSLRNDYPLSDLDGLSVWYESRLLELGIEDMQNLATANLVDVLLHSRVPVGRLVDWVDQAHLYLHLEPKPRGGGGPRQTLRSLGIRTATGLEDAMRQSPDGEPVARGLVSAEANQQLLDDLCWALNDGGLKPSVTTAMLKSIENDPNLKHVRNWKKDWSRPLRMPVEPSVVFVPVGATNGNGRH